MKKTTRKAAQATTRLSPLLFVRLFASRRSRCSPAAIQRPGILPGTPSELPPSRSLRWPLES